MAISSSANTLKPRDARNYQMHQTLVTFTTAENGSIVELSPTYHMPQVCSLISARWYNVGGTSTDRTLKLWVQDASESSIVASARPVYESDATAAADNIADAPGSGVGVPVYIGDGESLYIETEFGSGTDHSGTIELIFSPNFGP